MAEIKINDQMRKQADQQIKGLQREVRFDTRDLVIEYIVDKFNDDLFFIPDYQREFIWRDHHRHRFIESVILGLPIPMMFFAEIEEDGRLEIVDGAQRVQTLEAFLNDDLRLDDLEKLPTLNGFSFSDLPKAQQNKFRTKAIRVVVLDDTTSEATRKEIFNRINTSGERAKPSEVRRGAYAGKFMDFIEECANDERFQRLCPITEAMRKRREPQEIILRFFAYSDGYTRFSHSVEKFLNAYIQKHKDKFEKKRMKSEFDAVMNFADRFLPHGFAKQKGAKQTPRVRFEALAVGINLALRQDPDLRPASLGWMDSEDFKVHTTSHASNSRPRLRGRVEFVRDQLLGEDN